MSPRKPPEQPPDSLSLKIGGWFEAHATGRGVVAIAVLMLVLACAAGLKLALVR